MATSNLRSGRTSSATVADILVGEAISDENPSRLDSIDPANLFPRGDRAGIVTNGHLPDLVPSLRTFAVTSGQNSNLSHRSGICFSTRASKTL